MKTLPLVIIVAVAAFLGGVSCAQLLCNKHRSADRAANASIVEYNAESTVFFNLVNIDKAQRADNASIIGVNCVLIRSKIPLIRPADYEDPKKQKEVQDLLTRAKQTVAKLQASGSCESAARRSAG
jgi:hypothetical protein